MGVYIPKNVKVRSTQYGCAWCADHDRRQCGKNNLPCLYADILDGYDSYDDYDKEVKSSMEAAINAIFRVEL